MMAKKVNCVVKTKRKRKLGRPPIPKQQQRSRQISIRFTKEEIYQLEKQRVQEHTATFIRELLFESLERKKREHEQENDKKSA
jgi:hypothetical protein